MKRLAKLLHIPSFRSSWAQHLLPWKSKSKLRIRPVLLPELEARFRSTTRSRSRGSQNQDRRPEFSFLGGRREIHCSPPLSLILGGVGEKVSLSSTSPWKRVGTESMELSSLSAYLLSAKNSVDTAVTVRSAHFTFYSQSESEMEVVIDI